jgi:hypothetical protein
MTTGPSPADISNAGRRQSRPVPFWRTAVALTGVFASIAGFFLPWASGAGILSGRRFSGLDLALALRRVDLAVDTQWAIPASLALYLIPAVGVAGLVLVLLAPRSWLAAVPGLYTAAIALLTVAALFLGFLEVLARSPQPGLLLTLAGSVLAVAAHAGGAHRG